MNNTAWWQRTQYRPALVSDTWRKRMGVFFLFGVPLSLVLAAWGIYGLVALWTTGVSPVSTSQIPRTSIDVPPVVTSLVILVAGVYLAFDSVRLWGLLTGRRGLVDFRETAMGLELVRRSRWRVADTLAVPQGAVVTLSVISAGTNVSSATRTQRIVSSANGATLAFEQEIFKRVLSIAPLDDAAKRHGIVVEVDDSARIVKRAVMRAPGFLA
jgi:hypothetical protein